MLGRFSARDPVMSLVRSKDGLISMREIPCLFFFPYYPIRPHLYSLILPSVVGRCPSGYGLVCRCSRTSGRGHAEYYPAFLAAFAGKTTNLPRREARAVLALAPTPADTARLTKARIAAALRRAGRRRGVEDLAAKLHTALRAPHLRQPPLVERAMGVQALALLTALNPAVAGADQLAEATADAFSQHPDHAIIQLPRPGRHRRRPGPSRDWRRPVPVHRPARAQGLRRLRPSHPRIRAQHRHHPQTNQERPTRHSRLDLGVRVADPLTRGTGALRPPPNGRRPARRRAAPPVQPLPRPTPPLPDHRPAPHRGHSLPAAPVIRQRQRHAEWRATAQPHLPMRGRSSGSGATVSGTTRSRTPQSGGCLAPRPLPSCRTAGTTHLDTVPLFSPQAGLRTDGECVRLVDEGLGLGDECLGLLIIERPPSEGRIVERGADLPGERVACRRE